MSTEILPDTPSDTPFNPNLGHFIMDRKFYKIHNI
jgi:hypothetical protein